MNIIRVFPQRTSFTPKDELAFVGDPPFFRPSNNHIPVHVSCTFTWDLPKARRLAESWAQYYMTVKLGGPAFDDPCNGFTPGMYVKQGITITSRGCNNQCPWCLVSKREGKLRLLLIQEGNILQDNNILQCPLSHIDAVFDMLSHQRHVILSGGLESALLTQRIADRIRGLRIDQIFLACDTDGALKPLKKAVKLLQPSREKLRCYVLLKFNPEETQGQALNRLMQVYEVGCMPFAQLYQPPDRFIEYPTEWKQFARTWSRPAATKAFMKQLERNS